ncbi:MAG: 4Fe-4S double cluster binding domain-containing protein, partial [Bacteroidaceae bacterium]
AAFVLGELLLDFELPADSPQKNRCGDCKRCIEACPAQALIESTQTHSKESTCGYGQSFLDARRCLSYQTIENRDTNLSAQTIEALGERIYGCDACQKACPHTRYATAEETPTEFHPSPELLSLEKENWQTLSLETYRRLFKGSAVKRAKYEGLLRNIQAAKGNSSSKK